MAPHAARLRASTVLPLWLLASLAACGARTPLRIPDVYVPLDARDAALELALPDAPEERPLECDASVESCVPPTVRCGAGGSLSAGDPFTLTATAMATAPSRIVSERWALVSSPPSSRGSLSSATGERTELRGDLAGTYVARFTATDSAHREASCDVPVRVVPSYRGTDFWAVTTANSALLGEVFHFAVAIGNSNDDPVTVTITGGGLTAPRSFVVAAHSVGTQILPWVLSLSHNTSTLQGAGADCCDLSCCGGIGSSCSVENAEVATSSLVDNGAYHLVTTAPVSAYQFNPLEYSTTELCGTPTNSYTNDASLLLPTPALTGNYLTLTHNSFGAYGSFVTVVATSAEPTRLEVELSADLSAGPGVSAANARQTVSYTLQRGQVLQLVARPSGQDLTLARYGAQDMTATALRASAPVAVFAGVDCTNIGSNGARPACDHLEEQLFPLETWGRSAVVTQLRARGPNEPYTLRILSSSDGNTLTFTPPVHDPVTLRRGQYLEFEERADFEVSATAPILVGQFMQGQGTMPPAVGDPAFVLEVPSTQYRREYSFLVPSTYAVNYVQAVLRTGSTLLLDGAPLTGTLNVIAGTQWSVLRAVAQPGPHSLVSADGTRFGLKVLGVASYTSYMYPGGLDLDALL